MKIIFTMSAPQSKIHSTRFDLETIEEVLDQKGQKYVASPIDPAKFKPSFYLPKPLAEKAKRIRVTIEEL